MCAGSNAPARSRCCIIRGSCPCWRRGHGQIPQSRHKFRSRGIMMTAETHVSPKRPRARKLHTPTKARAGRKWHQVVVKHDKVSVIGGYNAHSEAAACIQYQAVGLDKDAMGNTVTHTFVELDKNAQWFLKGVGGGQVKKGDLKPVQVVDMIRHTFNLSLPGESDDGVLDASVAAAVAGTASEDSPEQDVDPMDDMDELAVPRALPKRQTAKARAKATANAKAKKLFRMEPQRLEVPTRPPCAGPPHLSTGPDADGQTEIWVFQSEKGQSASRRNDCHLYLRSDSIGWLLQYAADELHLQGVSAPAPDGGEQSPNCDAVDGLNVEWCFDSKAWEATFLTGEKLGTQLRVSVKDLNRTMWQQLYDISKVDGYFSKADPRQRKYATREFLVLVCSAIAGNKAEAIGLQDMIEPHGMKRVLEGTAVADSEDDAAVADAKADESDAALSDQDDDLENASGDDSAASDHE